MSSTVKFPNTVAKEKAAWLRHFGWECVGAPRGHFVFKHPEYEQIEISSTPKHSGLGATLAEIAKKTGSTKRDVQIELGLKERSSAAPKRKRKRNEAGRSARKFSSPPKQVAEAEEPREKKTMAQIAEELKYASGSRYDRLLSEHAELQRSYMREGA